MEMRWMLGVTIIALLLVDTGHCSSEVFSITPSPSDLCPTEPCLTLSQFAANSSNYLSTNATLFFLPGNHSLESILLIEKVYKLSMLSHFNNAAAIVCNHSWFKFNNVSEVYISGLTFIGCTGSMVKFVNHFTLENSSFTGQEDSNQRAITLIQSTAIVKGSTLSFYCGKKYPSPECDDFMFKYYSIHSRAFEVDVQSGGAIASVHSNVTIIESTFKGNSAQVGGAIFSELYSNITIINSEFVGNLATPVMSSGVHNQCYVGGAVLYAKSGSTVVAHNSEFKNNTSQWRGGVILLQDNHTTITINNSKFTDNRALAGAGGVLDSSDTLNAVITFSHSKFDNNRAQTSGGVLDSSDTINAVITFSHCAFTNNRAQVEGGVLCGIEVENMTLTFTDSTFVNNRADEYEGGVMSIWWSTNTIVTVNSSNFKGNKAQYGGVFSSTEDKVVIAISNSNFSSNSAVIGGVATISDGSHVIVSKSIFRSNRGHVSGGVLKVTSTDVEITQSTFVNNRAGHFGGTIDTKRSTIAIGKSQFHYNTAFHAGVVRSDESNVSISESDFFCNKADTNGGVLNVNKSNLIIARTSFTNNTARFGGVLWAQQSSVSSHDVTLSNNSVVIDGGVLHTKETNMRITGTDCSHNSAGRNGGIMYADGGIISISGSILDHNSANTDGGVFHLKLTNMRISGANFSHNWADNNGGTMYTDGGTTSISDSKFDHNTAGNDGGVIRSYLSETYCSECDFTDNQAENEGGVFYTDQSTLTVSQTSFISNTANVGGVLRADQCTSTINQTSFTNNTANTGGVIWAEQTTITSNAVNVTGNHANFSTVYLLQSTSLWSEITFLENEGSLLALGGAVTLTGICTVLNNMQPTHQTTIHKLQEGGAITLFQSDITFNGISTLMNNYAENGGALNAIESKVHINGEIMTANNIATETGGGIYLYHSELNCRKNSTLTVWRNTAKEKGGGIHAIGSSIKVIGSRVKRSHNPSLQLVGNKARKGGGLNIEMNTKLYILKLKMISNHQEIVMFTANRAEYGGAVYVSDDGMCSLSTVNECFFQTLAMYNTNRPAEFGSNDIGCQNIHFFNNTAKLSGHSLFGGLLDRCTVSPLAEPNINNINKGLSFSNGTIIVEGHKHFQTISNIQDSDIGSHPVRVCFCRNGKPDCSYQPDPIHIRKGEQRQVQLSLAIVDQINHPLKEATVYSHLDSGNYLCQNHIQSTDGLCGRVNFAVFSNNDTEELILSTGDGPCQNTPESQARVELEFSCHQCPIGFELDESRKGCDCVCDSHLFPFFTQCSGEILVRESNVWITYINASSSSSTHQYLIHPNCPRDYCQPPSSRVEINLNVLNGADTQCANGRSGLLCGTCQPGFSLSLGSSRCVPCSTNWLAVLVVIVIAAFLAGIALVVLLLMLNLTVAVGTINGIIFYANIVAANSSTFLPSSKPNFASVLISWLNLEVGFDTCFFDGMDAYWKTLLQLAFPAYIIFLVVMVIIISELSTRFAALIGNRNPVATLATLVLLSYAKFLHIIIASLSFAILDYPDGSHQVVWLPDATVEYLTGKHIALFIMVIFILMVGIPYTAVLLFWQWFLHHQDKKVFMWMKYQKLCHFIDPYHAPYTFKHRYWTGMLLLARVFLYIVSAVNVMGDPRVILVAIIFVVGCLLLVKGVFEKRVYKNWPIDIIETIMYFNILAFAVCTWYNFDTGKNQTVAAYTSVMITLSLLLTVIIFHLYKYTGLHSAIHKSMLFKQMRAKVQARRKKKQQKVENVDHGVLQPAAENLNTQKQQFPTYTLVEIQLM